MRAEPGIARAIGLETRALQVFGIGVIGSSGRRYRPESFTFGFRRRIDF